MTQPLVSIITPSYNQEKFIRRTIESVLAQDYKNIEYIVVDGGSTDNSLNIIKEYEGKLICVSEKDNGQSDAINKGFRMSHGDIVAWINSDDIYEPGCISRVLKEFEKNDKLGLVYGDGYIIDEDDNRLRVFEHTQKFDYWKLVNFCDYIMQPTAFFRREVLQKVGYLDVDLQYCMDWDLWIKIAAVSEVKYISELLACSREYANTKTSMGGSVRLKEITELLQKYSRKVNPLGVALYKASTLYMKCVYTCCPFRMFVGLYLLYKQKSLEKKIPKIYDDGWIGKKYALIIPKYIKTIQLIIECVLLDTIPQTIDLYVNQKHVKKKEIIQLGRYNISIDLEENNHINELRIECSSVVNVGKADARQLSIKILDILYDQ